MILVTSPNFNPLDKDNFGNQTLFTIDVKVTDSDGQKRDLRVALDVADIESIKDFGGKNSTSIMFGDVDVLYKRRAPEGTKMWVTITDLTAKPTFVGGVVDGNYGQVKYRLRWTKDGEENEMFLNSMELAQTQRVVVQKNGGRKTSIVRGIYDRFGAFTPDA
jgi:hypothetical protein